MTFISSCLTPNEYVLQVVVSATIFIPLLDGFADCVYAVEEAFWRVAVDVVSISQLKFCEVGVCSEDFKIHLLGHFGFYFLTISKSFFLFDLNHETVCGLGFLLVEAEGVAPAACRARRSESVV